MKQIKSHLFLLLSLLFSTFALSACSWEDLPSYEEANISAVQFYYRWASNVKDPITQEPIVKEVRLNTTSVVDADAGTIEATVRFLLHRVISRQLCAIKCHSTRFGHR